MAGFRSALHSVSGKYLEAVLDLMDVDEILLEDFIGSHSVAKVRWTYFNTDLQDCFLVTQKLTEHPPSFSLFYIKK